LVKPGGVIVIDNVLWYGKVSDDKEQDKTTIALRELNNNLLMDDRIDFSLIPVGDGMAMCRKR
jgi:predicted O-methyltransferase YrrM